MNNISYKHIIANFIFAITTIYFVYHCFIGERGYFKMLELKSELDIKKNELSKLSSQRKYLENRASLIYDKGIDKDLLDEISRSYFGVIHKDEVCIFKESN